MRTTGSRMKYKVIFMVGEKVLGSHTWVIGLDSAKEHAMDFLPVIHADRAEVRDENDVVVFHHTRTLDPPKPYRCERARRSWRPGITSFNLAERQHKPETASDTVDSFFHKVGCQPSRAKPGSAKWLRVLVSPPSSQSRIWGLRCDMIAKLPKSLPLRKYIFF